MQNGGNLEAKTDGKAFAGREFPWFDAPRAQVRPMARPEQPWEPERAAPSSGVGGGGGFTFASAVLPVTAALVLGGLLYLLLRHFRPPVAALELPKMQGEQFTKVVDAEQLPMPVEVRPDDFLSEARRRHAAGQYGEAVKYLYAHQLVLLDRAHHLRLERGKTNRQYLADLARSAPSGIDALVQASVEAFEAAFFGSLPPTPERMDLLWRGQQQLDAALALPAASQLGRR